jgi:PAS domain S-box-containing protein
VSRRARGITRDITEQKQAEAALREREERYRTLFQTMAQGVVYQSPDGTIEFANRSAEAILGLSLDQLQGRTSCDPKWRAVREDLSEFPGDEHPAMMALRTGKPVHEVVMGVFHPGHQAHRWLLVNAVPEFLPGEVRPRRVYTTFSDITERKRMEQADLVRTNAPPPTDPFLRPEHE